MTKGPNISIAVKKEIIRKALEERHRSRRVLAIELQDLIKRLGEPVPKPETLEKMISKARNQTPNVLDQPWSIAASLEYHLPTEATPTLMNASRYCSAVGDTFTIRQARWAAQIRPLFEDEDIDELVIWSHRYATHELVCQQIDEPGAVLETSDLDTAITRHILEYVTAFLLGKISLLPSLALQFPIRDTNSNLPAIGHKAAKLAERMAYTAMRLENMSITEALFITKECWSDLKSLPELKLSDHDAMVYAYWLATLMQCPRWETLSPEETRKEIPSIISQLREWIQNPPWKNYSLSEDMAAMAKQDPVLVLLSLSDVDFYPPRPLLEHVGFLPEDWADDPMRHWPIKLKGPRSTLEGLILTDKKGATT